MRILQVSDSFYPFKGGVTEHIYHLSKELIARGHEVVVLTTNYPGCGRGTCGTQVPLPHQRLGHVLILPPLKIFNYSSITVTLVNPLEVRDFLKNEKFDIIHSHGPLTFNLPQMALHYSKSCNVATFHTKFVGFNWNKIFKLFFGREVRKIHTAIFVSKTAYETAKNFKIPNYEVIPNGIDTERFTPHGPKINFDKPVVLFVGRFERRKGLDVLIKAVREMDVLLVVAGDGPLRKIYEQMAPDAKFLGEVEPDRLPEIYRSADVFVAPSIAGESFGIVLLEAMASGVPVVASDIEGYRNVIEHGKNGLLFASGSPEALRNQLFEVLKKPELRNNLINEGLATVRKFSWSLIANRVEKVYKTCLKEGKNGKEKTFP